MAMAMTINGCKPCEKDFNQLILPVVKNIIFVNRYGIVFENLKRTQSKLIHFSMPRTKLFLYNFIVACNNANKILPFIKRIKIWSAYIKNDIMFNIFHYSGKILRFFGQGKLVESLKSRIGT